MDGLGYEEEDGGRLLYTSIHEVWDEKMCLCEGQVGSNYAFRCTRLWESVDQRKGGCYEDEGKGKHYSSCVLIFYYWDWDMGHVSQSLAYVAFMVARESDGSI